MADTILQISYTLSTIKTAADKLWQFAHQQRVWIFNGEMGAGKTTLIHAICDNLGVLDAVSSPTFALMNEYHYNDATGRDRSIFHMDWYRLRDESEAINAGMEDALNSGDHCFVEWAEKASGLLPAKLVRISIEELPGMERRLTAEIN